MPDYLPDDEARDRRLAEIRARRGTPERQAALEAMKAAKARTNRPSQSSADGRKTPENSRDFFGHPWPQWFAMRDAGYEHIIERARKRQTTTYRDLWAAVARRLGEDIGNPWRQIDDLLGYIGQAAYEKDRVMPTAVVMYEGADDAGPGPGFFRLATSMGLFPEVHAPAAGEKWATMTDVQRRFWEEQRDLLFDYFADR